VLAALQQGPGTTAELAARLGWPVKRTGGNVQWQRRKGRVEMRDGRWYLVGAPASTPAVSAPAAPAPTAPLKSTAELFLEALETGPSTVAALRSFATANGRPVRDDFLAGNILHQLEKRGQVAWDGRTWSLRKKGA
jgi:hypothetical protein